MPDSASLATAPPVVPSAAVAGAASVDGSRCVRCRERPTWHPLCRCAPARDTRARPRWLRQMQSSSARSPTGEMVATARFPR
eukprot:366024-Chlamydomonas_euryale.AAC.15